MINISALVNNRPTIASVSGKREREREERGEGGRSEGHSIIWSPIEKPHTTAPLSRTPDLKLN